MKLLNDIPSKYFVSVDIETVRIKEEFEDLSDDWQSAWEYKNKQDGEIPDNDELAEMWTKKAALYAEFSKVCAVSLTFLDTTEDKLMCKEFYGKDENKLLEDLKVFLDRIAYKDKSYRLVGHAAKYFDYPYLCKRYVINGIDVPIILDTAHLKPWESKNLCTNADVWKMGGTGSGSSLQALCTALNIPISKVDLVGDEVGSAYFRGEYQRIGRYCSLDTIATFNVIRKIKKEKVFSFEEVVYIEQETTAPEPKEIPLLERLYQTNSFSADIKEGLEKLLKKKKITAKDKENLFKIIYGVYIHSNFEQNDMDSKRVLEQKTKEVNEFINSL